MAEKPPSFIVSDRRKFTQEGDLRDESTTLDETTPAPTAVAEEPAPGPRLVTPATPSEDAALAEEEGLMPEPTAQESAEQHAAYQQSSQDLDTMLHQANPGMGASAAVSMEHIIQSMYISAVVAMGGATEPGQKPRIDIIGARQSIDMLAVLQEKTTGNLNEKEQRLLQNALFELRMMFLEITNAIAQQAQKPKGTK
jgi:hypothetical protein